MKLLIRPYHYKINKSNSFFEIKIPYISILFVNFVK